MDAPRHPSIVARKRLIPRFGLAFSIGAARYATFNNCRATLGCAATLRAYLLFCRHSGDHDHAFCSARAVRAFNDFDLISRQYMPCTLLKHDVARRSTVGRRNVCCGIDITRIAPFARSTHTTLTAYAYLTDGVSRHCAHQRQYAQHGISATMAWHAVAVKISRHNSMPG